MKQNYTLKYDLVSKKRRRGKKTDRSIFIPETAVEITTSRHESLMPFSYFHRSYKPLGFYYYLNQKETM